MKIAVIGTGYVGIVTGTCFADSGNDVTCIDVDEQKITALNNGEVPIYEPGLAEMVRRNVESDRLHFTTDTPTTIQRAEIVYLAVGTPQSANGSANLTALWTAVDTMAPHLDNDVIIVTKSTVPVGTNAKIFDRLKERTGRECRVASNPEFLKEGVAIDDFMKPDRVVVGVRSEGDATKLHQLYKPFLRTEKPFLVMSPESAEMTKYVANALLATKISFINEMANFCERLGGDINDVRRGIGHDSRIGFAFLFPGVGYGGSCFPKDVRALASMAEDQGFKPLMLRAVDAVNDDQKRIMPEKLEAFFEGNLRGKVIAVWGLAFKPRTDDIREAPALVLLEWLLQKAAIVRVHDPEAMANVRAEFGDRLTYCTRQTDALDNADALVIMTEWGDYQRPDFETMYTQMRKPVIFDGRNLYELEQMRERGFIYHSIGRPTVGSD